MTHQTSNIKHTNFRFLTATVDQKAGKDTFGMPDYGRLDYWNNRYSEYCGMAEPFDWLFDYKDVAGIFEKILPDKTKEILIVGAGNAPFSPDMYNAGFTNITNTDLSEVVIDSQMRNFPALTWLVMDVRTMSFEDNSFPAVIDKSLVDTMLCYENSAVNTKAMIAEIFRVLRPGGIYVTFSLHPVHEVDKYFTEVSGWEVASYRVPSSRWNDKENRKRSVTQSMIICQKAPVVEKIDLTGVLPSDEELDALELHADMVNLRLALDAATAEELLLCLDGAVERLLLFPETNGEIPTRESYLAEQQQQQQQQEQERSEDTINAKSSRPASAS